MPSSDSMSLHMKEESSTLRAPSYGNSGFLSISSSLGLLFFSTNSPKIFLAMFGAYSPLMTNGKIRKSSGMSDVKFVMNGLLF